MAKVKNIFPHVGISYTAAVHKKTTTENTSIPTLFAPFVSNRGPENIPYKVYTNAEFISAFGSLEYSEQGQQVLNIGNWLNSGGAVLAYRMTNVPDAFIDDISTNAQVKTFRKSDDEAYITVNGIVTDTKPTTMTKKYVQPTKWASDITYYTHSLNELNKDVFTIANLVSRTQFTENANGKALYVKSEVYKYVDSKGYTDEQIKKIYCYSLSNGKYVRAVINSVSDLVGKAIYYKTITMTPADEFIAGKEYYRYSKDGNITDNASEYGIVADDTALGATAVIYSFTEASNTYDLFAVDRTVTTIDKFTKYYEEVVDYNLNSSNVNLRDAQVSQDGKYIKVTGIPGSGVDDASCDYEVTQSGERIRLDDTQLISAYCMHEDYVIKAKYSGEFYDGMVVNLVQTAAGMFRIDVVIDGTTVESFSRKTKANYRDIRHSSDYIGDIYLSTRTGFLTEIDAYNRSAIKTKSFTLHTPARETITYTKFDESKIGSAVANALEDKLSIKADYVLDAGYKASTKLAICDALIKADGVRDDIIFVSDCYELNYASNTLPSGASWPAAELTDSAYELRNLAVYEQYASTEDIYSETSGAEVYVTPTYFLAGLLPYNEINYGIFLPTAGKKRGVITDALSVNKNPSSSQKDEWYEQHINYIERDSASIQFMSQSTYSSASTALRFINNSRTLNKICRDVELLGRNYLFEDVSNTTIRSLENAISRYMSTWEQNRALSKCECEVYADSDDDTLVHIVLNIKFTGIIEVISVEINID